MFIDADRKHEEEGEYIQVFWKFPRTESYKKIENRTNYIPLHSYLYIYIYVYMYILIGKKLSLRVTIQVADDDFLIEQINVESIFSD